MRREERVRRMKHIFTIIRLSYVGLGTQPPVPSWGRMLADAQTMVSFAPHVAIIPGSAIIVTVLGLNLMGDGLRDVLDPRVRKSRE